MELLQHLPAAPAPRPPQNIYIYLSISEMTIVYFNLFTCLFILLFWLFILLIFILIFFLCITIFHTEGFGMFRVSSFIDSQRELLRLFARSFVLVFLIFGLLVLGSLYFG